MPTPNPCEQSARHQAYLTYLDSFLDRRGEPHIGPITSKEVMFLIGHYLRYALEVGSAQPLGDGTYRTDFRWAIAAIRITPLVEAFGLDEDAVLDLLDRLVPSIPAEEE